MEVILYSETRGRSKRILGKFDPKIHGRIRSWDNVDEKSRLLKNTLIFPVLIGLRTVEYKKLVAHVLVATEWSYQTERGEKEKRLHHHSIFYDVKIRGKKKDIRIFEVDIGMRETSAYWKKYFKGKLLEKKKDAVLAIRGAEEKIKRAHEKIELLS